MSCNTCSSSPKYKETQGKTNNTSTSLKTSQEVQESNIKKLVEMKLSMNAKLMISSASVSKNDTTINVGNTLVLSSTIMAYLKADMTHPNKHTFKLVREESLMITFSTLFFNKFNMSMLLFIHSLKTPLSSQEVQI